MKDGKDAYRPSYGGFVDVDLKDMKLSLRSLVCRFLFSISLH